MAERVAKSMTSTELANSIFKSVKQYTSLSGILGKITMKSKVKIFLKLQH